MSYIALDEVNDSRQSIRLIVKRFKTASPAEDNKPARGGPQNQPVEVMIRSGIGAWSGVKSKPRLLCHLVEIF